jgi:cytochrome P450
MSTPDAGLTRLFHLEPDLLRCPHALFEQLRTEQPVTFAPEIECWVVSRFDDIVHVARRPDVFSSMRPTGPVLARQQRRAFEELAAEDPELAAVLTRVTGRTRVLLNADPPDHARQRKLVNRAFTPPKVKSIEPRIRLLAHRLVDAFADRGEAELVQEYGVLLPLTIIAECLGVADGDLPMFQRWSDDFVASIGNHDLTKEQFRSLVQSQHEFFDYFIEKIAARRAEPRDDLITDVVHATLDDEPLTDHEILWMFNQFLVAGNETTTKLLASAMRVLLAQPELMARLRADPTLLAGFVEEVLRLESPVQGLFRTAVTDTEIGGVPITAGDHVLLLFAAGNRDDAKFPDPDDLDPCRANAMQNLAFGHGEHYCLGSALARAEARIGLEVLLERLDDIRPAPGVDLELLEYEPSYILHGLRRLPIVFTPTTQPREAPWPSLSN